MKIVTMYWIFLSVSPVLVIAYVVIQGDWSRMDLERDFPWGLQLMSLHMVSVFWLWLSTWEGLEGPWKKWPLVFFVTKGVLWVLSALLFLFLCLCSLASWVVGMGGLFVFLMYQDTDLSPSWNTFFLISLVLINLGVLGAFLL